MKPTRRWFQYSLRSFLVLLTASAVWLGILVNRAREQREAVRAIEAAGGEIYYDWQAGLLDPLDGSFDPLSPPLPNGPAWLRRIIGDDYFQSVYLVSSPDSPKSHVLELIPHLRRLRGLKKLLVPYPISEDMQRELETELPNCEIWWPGHDKIATLHFALT